ncbi:GntR family transcriptional regulator [Schaalia vaccimaxillae]|uniref:GntR family transcriptional regulator n=1 Tax=Schaalia vaccimaxillae TaxID=183916 RepID=UPI0003B35C22|nr:GntR family transcriptional regulator [Schaalia vaccimaxillae]
MRIDDTRPIWVQLAQEFAGKIASGLWASGTRISSVRELAGEMGVNPNTVQRALGQLDADGLTVTERTAGRYVTTDQNTIAQARHQLASNTTDAYIATIASLGLELDEATKLLAARWVEYPQGDAS